MFENWYPLRFKNFKPRLQTRILVVFLNFRRASRRLYMGAPRGTLPTRFPQMLVESEVTYSRLTSNLRGSFGRGGGLTAPRHQISLCGSNSGSIKKKSRKLYEWTISPVRSAALWGRASTTTGAGVFPDVCDQPLTENLERKIDEKYITSSVYATNVTVTQSYLVSLNLTHWFLKFFAKSAFFRHLGDFLGWISAKLALIWSKCVCNTTACLFSHQHRVSAAHCDSDMRRNQNFDIFFILRVFGRESDLRL